MGRHLVTGIAGFIGSAVARALLQRGHAVVGVDNLSTGYAENIPEGVTFIQSDCQADDLPGRLPDGGYEAIFHIAGQSSGEISFDDSVYDLRTNAESTLRLLKFALLRDCRRFIYAGTMSVYGRRPDAPTDEEAPCFPESFYGVGKLASEHYLRLYEQYGIRSTSLRLFNVYGPGQNMANLRQGMVSIFMAMMLKNGHIHVKGNPSRYRDFVYIDDVVQAFLLCLERPESAGRALNIACGNRVQVGDLVEKIQALHPTPVTVEYSGATAGDIHGIYADISMAARYLGYEPSVGLEKGLQRMYARHAGDFA